MVEALSGNWGILLILLLRFTSIVIPILPGTYCLLISGYLFGLVNGLLLSFIADFQIGRRHTSKLFADLPGRIDSVIGQAIACRQIQDQRIDFLKNTNFDTLLGDQTDRYVHDIAIKALDEKIVTGSSIPRVLNQWRKPRHNEFQPRTGWSLFNSFTEVTKRQHAGNSMVTTRKLHTLLYDFCQSISA